jgi:hypothetical protein
MNADPYNLPLTAQQRARLERARDKGEMNGVGSMYHLLRNEMGPLAPNKNQIATFMRALPSVQINKTTKSVAGKKNVIGPMLPPPIPIGWCASDCAFIPACYNPIDKKKYSAVCVYICGLTKFIYVHACTLNSDDRPLSTQTREGLKEFIRRARALSGDDDLHPMQLKSDHGSEYKGAFATFMTQQQNQNPGFYEQKYTTGSRAASNAWAERVLQSWRRLLYSYYRQTVLAFWETNNIPAQQRTFNWVPIVDVITKRYNERRHNTIKATPMDAIAGVSPTYQETQQQIIDSARKRYANHESDRMQPGFSSEQNRDLDIGDLVRTLNPKSGPGRATWNAKKSNKMSAGGNWSEELFVVARLRRANNNWGNSSYIIAELDQTQPNNIGDHKFGVYTRQQLLFCPMDTLNYLPSDSSSSDDDEDDEDADQPVDGATVSPRPPVNGTWRYRVGDILLFTAAFFNAQPGGLNGLEAPPMRRDRTGIIRTRTRERARGANRGQYLYSVLFNDPAITVPRLPLDNDDDATFLAET